MTGFERVRNGYRVKTQGGYHLEIRPQLRLFRLAEVPVEEPRDFARFWCYSSFEAAALAALAWEVDDSTTPVGWVRAGGGR